MTTQRPLWVDQRLRETPQRPWRKIHLDYHNSQYMPQIGEAFDPDEFGDTLQLGHVDSVVVFAKDMHGFFYMPTETGPVHPSLTYDLLGKQVQACRERGIKVYAYYCVTWDNDLAEKRPEWLAWKRDRTTYLPKFDQTPGWTSLCLSNPDFVQLVLDHSAEIMVHYDLDGIWYDMPLPQGGECFCKNCLAELRAAGLDPFDVSVQRHHKQFLLTDFMRRAHELAHAIRPGCQVDQNNQTRLGLGARTPYMDNIDIEALPTAFWGYLYYPTNVRYARTFGTSVCGMSGRFHRAWADFGGLKHINQLRAELPGIYAHGAQCDLGDQLPPNGRLDRAVYTTIGQAYAEVERLEPFLERAVPVTEAAILVSGNPLDDLGTAHPDLAASFGQAVFGLTKLLMELHIQFDIVEPDAAFERYRLVVLPDGMMVDAGLARRLQAYIATGGAVIGAHHAMRLAGSETLWAGELLGLEYRGESPYAPAYLKLGAALAADLPDYEYALYDGAAQWQPHNTAASWAQLGEPLFQRGPQHYTSHGQTPFDHVTEYAAVAVQGSIAAAAFPLGASYYRHGYWIYREVFKHMLQAVLPRPLITTNAPLSAEVTVTHQVATEQHPERWMVHIVNFSPNRRSTEHCEYLEDPIPLHDIQVTLDLDLPIVRAILAPDGTPLELGGGPGGWSVVVPKVTFGAVVAFEGGAS